MFKMVDLKDFEYSVKFSYEDYTDMDEKFSHRTLCAIRKNSTGDFFIGIATCSKKDKYDKHYGRRLAFQRAIAKLTNNKEERLRFWIEFFKNIRKDFHGVLFFKSVYVVPF